MRFITIFLATLLTKVVWRFRRFFLIGLISISGYLANFYNNPVQELTKLNNQAEKNAIVYRKRLTGLSKILCSRLYGKKVMSIKFPNPKWCRTKGEY